jgi:hypothetical protein
MSKGARLQVWSQRTVINLVSGADRFVSFVSLLSAPTRRRSEYENPDANDQPKPRWRPFTQVVTVRNFITPFHLHLNQTS